MDVRVIASTNRNLPEKIKRSEFREDLFYRLNVLPIELPPLRERRDDIPLLVDHFLEKHCSDLKKARKTVSATLMDGFLRSPWEGNVRELENVILRGILYSPEDEIRPEHVGFQAPIEDKNASFDDAMHNLDYREAKEEVLRRFHASYIGNILSHTQGNVSQAARLLGLERQGLQQLMRRYGIRSDAFRNND